MLVAGGLPSRLVISELVISERNANYDDSERDRGGDEKRDEKGVLLMHTRVRQYLALM